MHRAFTEIQLSQSNLIFYLQFDLALVRKQLDMSPGFIINYIENKNHINMTYNKTLNAKTKALTKMFGD